MITQPISKLCAFYCLQRRTDATELVAAYIDVLMSEQCERMSAWRSVRCEMRADCAYKMSKLSFEWRIYGIILLADPGIDEYNVTHSQSRRMIEL